MSYRVMQLTEDGMEFCAASDFATWRTAFDWINANGDNWPESRFIVEGEHNYPYDYDDAELDDIEF